MEHVLEDPQKRNNCSSYLPNSNSTFYSYFKNPNGRVEIEGFEYIKQYYLERYFLFRADDSRVCAVVSDQFILENFPKIPSGSKTLLVAEEEFTELLIKLAARQNTSKARFLLEELFPDSSARTINYKKRICGFAIVFLTTLFQMPALFCIVNNLLYTAHSLFRAMLFINSGNTTAEPMQNHFCSNSPDLPIYSILVPLYKEKEKLWSIIDSIAQLNYPQDRLDVKLIIEEDDDLTIKELKKRKIPNFIHVIYVPYSLPRTKPKAMNYAMSYVRGEFLVIYDAEDVPDKNQLIDALNRFANLPEEYVCLQARLNYYNAEENFLTRFFSLEYGLWFTYLLKGLSHTNLPIPLGGTSNHFKTKALEKVGAWDAFNVTEDADLGVRLFRQGYKVHVLDSDTLEESPISIRAWLSQRARWIKGFIQTQFVFMRATRENKALSFSSKVSTYLLVGLSSYSFICLPWLVILHYFISEEWASSLIISHVLSVAYMYSTAFIALWDKAGKITNLSARDVVVLICWPFYFLLHTLASYIAIYQCISNPFKWNKTRHGVSDNLTGIKKTL